MKHAIFYFALLSGTLLLLQSCADDNVNTVSLPPDAVPPGMKAIELNITVQNQPDHKNHNQARTIDLNENKIDNMEAFLFNPAGILKKRIATSDIRTVNTNNGVGVALRLLIPGDEVPQYESRQFKIVVVANAAAAIPATVETLEDLQEIVQETTDINNATPQPKFLMDGEINSQPIIWESSPVYTVPGQLPLQRAAAKIRLRLKEINVKENGRQYEMEGQPRVKLARYSEKTSMLQNVPCEMECDNLKTSAFRDMDAYSLIDTENETSLTHSIPFYAYENNWKDSAENETHLILQINFKEKDAAGNYGTPKPYYYRLPINYRMPLPGMTNDEIAKLYRLERNHLYNIAASVGVLGGEDEETP